MPAPARPPTPESALAWAQASSANPAAVRPLPHAAFDADPTAGGYAFVDDTRWFYVCHNGTWGTGILGPAPGPAALLDEQLARNRHTARPLAWAELGAWQRAAITAVHAGTTVSDLTPAERPGIDSDLDRDHADWIWIALTDAARRGRTDPVRALAADDALLEPPVPGSRAGRRTHPCPLCERPARHSARYPRAVCTACQDRAVDSLGRPVVGHNTSLGGGFVARYRLADGTAPEVCEEVTRTGRCRVDGHECSIGEAHFGGVVVEAL